MAPTNATYFFITDQRATDRTKHAPASSTSTSSQAPWRYVR
jgi:hypothetical protein